MTTFKFNTEFNRIAGENRAWDFEIKKTGVNITFNSGKVYTSIGSLKPLDELRTEAILWFELNINNKRYN
jgi:hypothetical protein